MEHEKIPIDSKTLILSLGVVFLIETGTKMLVFAGVQNSMMLLGVMRLLEAASLILLVIFTEGGLSAIGLEKGRTLHGIRRGLFWSVCFGAVAVFALALFQAMDIHLLDMIRIPLPANSETIFLLFLVGGWIGPVAEEIFFRGIVFGFFRRWGMVSAVLFSTLLFVIAHPVLPAIPVIQITGGLVFAVAYEIEGTLLAPLSIHILGNMAIYSASLLFC